MSDEILVKSLVGYHSGEPLVEFEWGEKKGQLTSTEARAHALKILEAADAAESDLFLWEFATSTIGATTGGAAKLIDQFRQFRAGRR